MSASKSEPHPDPAGRPPDQRPKVAAILPAYNEAERIGGVLRAVVASRLVDEVVVVDDCSVDATAEVAGRFEGVRVIRLPRNLGKGGAMAAGVSSTDAELLVFVDADLVGFQTHHLDAIVSPVLLGECDMCVGVFRGGRFWSDTAQWISPYISGQRALWRRIFEAVPMMSELRMGAEVALNTAARRQKAVVRRVILHGVSNTFKEHKMGLVRGAAARARMYSEIGRAMVRIRRRYPRRVWRRKGA